MVHPVQFVQYLKWSELPNEGELTCETSVWGPHVQDASDPVGEISVRQVLAISTTNILHLVMAVVNFFFIPFTRNRFFGDF